MNANGDWRAQRVRAGDVELCTYRRPECSDKPPVLMLHGMRDVAASLQPVATGLLARFDPILVDLRGHGASDKPGAYSMEAQLHDLYCLTEAFSPDAPALIFGHSLGGQIVARFAGLWPDRVRALVIAEGLGPPTRVMSGDEATQARLFAQRILDSQNPKPQRPLPDLGFAAARLQANNPRMDAEYAHWLAQQATMHNERGELVWRFDPRVQQVFVGTTEAAGAALWRQATSPALIIVGAESHEYWRSAIAGDEHFTGRFEPGEYEARAANFSNHELRSVADAGHMLHYDQPEQLAQLTLDFLERAL